MVAIKAADDTESLYIYIDGNIDQTYQLFLDADNENSTGNEYTATNWGGMGAMQVQVLIGLGPIKDKSAQTRRVQDLN